MAGAICEIHSKIPLYNAMHLEEALQNKELSVQLISKLFEIAVARNLREIQPNPHLPEALELFKKYGFTEVTVTLYWK